MHVSTLSSGPEAVRVIASGAHHALIPASTGTKSIEFFCPRINLLSSSLSSGLSLSLSLSSCSIYYDFNLGQEKRIKKWSREKEGRRKTELCHAAPRRSICAGVDLSGSEEEEEEEDDTRCPSATPWARAGVTQRARSM